MRRGRPGLRSRARRTLLGAALAGTATAMIPGDARARDDDPTRPWSRSTIRPSFGFGLGLGSDATQLGFGIGASYFVANGLGLGLSLSDSVIIFKDSFKASFPGVEKQIPTNIFRLVPSLQYVFFRSRWFSPYVHAGVGPAFFNNQRGTVGYWVAGPGAYIGIGGPAYLVIGVDFSGMFPISKCNRAFSYESGGERVQFEGYCAFGWSPHLGIAIAFGGGASKRRSKPKPPPPDNPLPETIEPPARIEQPPPPSESPTAPAEPIGPPPPGDGPLETPPPDPLEPPPPGDPPSGPQPPVAVPD